jgi:hypothetical protein
MHTAVSFIPASPSLPREYNGRRGDDMKLVSKLPAVSKKLFSFLICSAASVLFTTALGSPKPRLAFVTYLHQESQERAAAMLVDSIRRWGGEYAACPIYAVLTNPGRTGSLLQGKAVDLVSLALDESVRVFPFAAKAFAAAHVEQMTGGKIDTLVWLDPETLLFGPPAEYDLKPGAETAVAPVSLVNIGQSPDEPIDAFWAPIYRRCGLDPAAIFSVETFVDSKKVRIWLNCGMFSVRPERGLLREWAKILDEFLRDADYQRAAVSDALHRTFLHQAVISTLIASRLKGPEIHWLPKGYNYPLYCHGLGFTGASGIVHLVPDRKKIKTLDELTSVFVESLLAARPDWIQYIPPASEPLRTWLVQEVREIYGRQGGKEL